MKSRYTTLALTLLFAAVGHLSASDAPAATKVPSAEFARMKALAGTWRGKADMGQGPVDMTIEYRLVAGGSALLETIAPGTPHEMVSLYYDKAGKLAMTHYCILGNRPEMALKASDATSLTFDLDSCCGIDPRKEATMAGVKITFNDADTITSVCRGFADGHETPAHPTTFKRVKTTAAR